MSAAEVHSTAADAARATDGAVDVWIGMRWEHLWKLGRHPWVPLAFARMLTDDDPGLQRSWLALRPRGPAIAQRWSTAERLDGWSRDKAHAHAPAWGRFAREHGSIARWGIWHEVRAADPC